MHLATSAAILYGVVVLYLVARGVDARRIARIAFVGLLAGVLGAYTLGLAYFLVVLVKPVETIAVFSMATLLISAAYFAREEILGTIAPAGIVFLNIAANVAPAGGPLPLSLVWLAALIPVPYGAVRVALNLLVIYSPTLVALYLLRKGPPGNAALRYILGAWVCWVGIAAIAGPGWEIVRDFRLEDPARWLASGFAAYAFMHVVMLALNLVISVASDEDDAARSIARSVRVDSMPPSIALALGMAFWLGTFLFMRLPLDPDLKAGAVLAAAFGLGSVLARRRPEVETGEEEPQTRALGFVGLLATYLAFGGTLLWLWVTQDPARRAATQVLLNPVTGIQLEVRAPVPGMTLRYPQPELHERLKELLAKEGVPFTTLKIRGEEYLRVADEHGEAAKRAIAAIEGPALPSERSTLFKGEPRDHEFTRWLTDKGVKWELVKKQRDTWLVWEAGPRHEWLHDAFVSGQSLRWLGVDYYALKVIAPKDPTRDLDKDRSAAFDTPEHRASFVTWLQKRGIKPQSRSRDGHEFIVWQSAEAGLLNDYIGEMRHKCLDEYRAVWDAAQKAAKGATPVVRNPC
jgi:hypothetical protein